MGAIMKSSSSWRKQMEPVIYFDVIIWNVNQIHVRTCPTFHVENNHETPTSLIPSVWEPYYHSIIHLRLYLCNNISLRIGPRICFVLLCSAYLVSCQKGPTHHAYAWQIGPFWQDTLDIIVVTDSCNSFNHILQDCCAGTGTILQTLPVSRK